MFCYQLDNQMFSYSGVDFGITYIWLIAKSVKAQWAQWSDIYRFSSIRSEAVKVCRPQCFVYAGLRYHRYLAATVRASLNCCNWYTIRVFGVFRGWIRSSTFVTERSHQIDKTGGTLIVLTKIPLLSLFRWLEQKIIAHIQNSWCTSTSFRYQLLRLRINEKYFTLSNIIMMLFDAG